MRAEGKSRRRSLVAAAVAWLLIVPAAYAAERVVDVLVNGEAAPASAAWSGHIPMFWRLGVAVYVGGLVSPLAYMAASRGPERTFRVLGWCMLLVSAVIGAQGLLLP